MKVKILGISGSTRKNGNTDILVSRALQGAATVEDVETEFVSLSSKKVLPCTFCEIYLKIAR